MQYCVHRWTARHGVRRLYADQIRRPGHHQKRRQVLWPFFHSLQCRVPWVDKDANARGHFGRH